MPHSDAENYFSDALRLGLSGEWGAVASRRPIAAAFRQIITALADHSYLRTVSLQTTILVLALWYSAYRLMLWRGFLPGIVFAALTTLLASPFVGTFLTEPLSMVWVLFSIVFLIEALRRHSLGAGLVALSALTLAMLTRMGAMLILPFFALWLIVFFARGVKSRLVIASLAAAAIVIPLFLNFTLARLYGTADSSSGTDFAITICRLSLDDSCLGKYDAEFHAKAASQKQQIGIALRHATENVQADARPLLRAMYNNIHRFVRDAPGFYLDGYRTQNFFTREAEREIFALIIGLVCLFLILVATNSERFFWITFVVGTIGSTAIIMAEDGWRTLHVSHIYSVLLLSCGFSLFPHKHHLKVQDIQSRWGIGVLALAGLLLVAVPALSGEALRREFARHSLPVTEDPNEIILAGPRLTGFLVVPDGLPLRQDIPSLPFSEFENLIRATLLERDVGNFLDRLDRDSTFAFISGLVIRQPSQPYSLMVTYIAPARALEEKNAWALVMALQSPIEQTQIHFARVVQPVY
jgi:hypothetical protein